MRLLDSNLDVECDPSVHETAIKSIENELNYLDGWKLFELIKFLVHTSGNMKRQINKAKLQG